MAEANKEVGIARLAKKLNGNGDPLKPKLRLFLVFSIAVALLMLMTLSFLGGCSSNEQGLTLTETVGQTSDRTDSQATTTGPDFRVKTEPKETPSYAEAEVDIETENEASVDEIQEPDAGDDSAAGSPETAAGGDEDSQNSTDGGSEADFSVYFSFVSPNPVVSGANIDADVVIAGSAESVALQLRHSGETVHEYPMSLAHQGHGQETWTWSGSAPAVVDGGYKVYISAFNSSGKSEVQFHGVLQVVKPSQQSDGPS